MDYYKITRNYLKKILDKPTFENWIEPLSYIGTKNNLVFVGSPDKKRTSWLRANLLEKINGHLKKEFGCLLKIVPLYEDNEEVSEDFTEPSRINLHNANLQKRYTFESFVQLDSNRMAYSFAYSVSEFPGKSYNPLYIYSDVGLGKTHLINAIGNHLIQHNPGIRVVYLTTSDLMNEYVEHTRLNKRSEFIKKYTSVEVLLIDDIQYITRWGGTSEQFYYIFNKLIQLEKQIVICSDKHPDNIPDLESRIKSRFEWGGIVDILPYDLEGRIAILKQKILELQQSNNLTKKQFNIPDEVIFFLASSIKDNIRKLEGSLKRLIGYADLKYADLSDNRITLSFAKEALKPYVALKKKSVTIERIQELVAKKYSITTKELKSKNNSPRVAEPRQVAMYVCKQLTKCPLKEIGSKFGGKHHTTVLHSIKKVESKLDSSEKLANDVKNMVKFFRD